MKNSDLRETASPGTTRAAEILEEFYKRYHKPEYIDPDPLIFPRRYSGRDDVEAAAFIAASFALGRVTAIIAFLERIFSALGNPCSGITGRSEAELRRLFSGFKYRFYSEDDVAALMIGMRRIYLGYGSLENCFKEGMLRPPERSSGYNIDVINGLQMIADEINGRTGRVKSSGGCRDGGRNVVTDPAAGSACKRMNLFLRWVARDDRIDTGIWDIGTGKLLIPLDTHVMKVSRMLGLTGRNTADLKTAVEITESLKRFDNDDPVRYDFSMSRIGIHPDLTYSELERVLM